MKMLTSLINISANEKCFLKVSAANMLYKNKNLRFLRLYFSLGKAFQNAGKMNYGSPFIVHLFQTIIDSNLFKDAWLF